MDTPEGQQSIDALDLVFGALDHVDVDASQRKIVWTDGKRLSIEEAAERLHAEHPDNGGIRPAHGVVARRLRAQAIGRRKVAENSALSRTSTRAWQSTSTANPFA